MLTRSSFLSLILVMAAGLLLSGCASTPKDGSEPEKVSTLPWNKPQQWEHSAPLGGGATY